MNTAIKKSFVQVKPCMAFVFRPPARQATLALCAGLGAYARKKTPALVISIRQLLLVRVVSAALPRFISALLLETDPFPIDLPFFVSPRCRLLLPAEGKVQAYADSYRMVAPGVVV
jgi:hypothetical protein